MKIRKLKENPHASGQLCDMIAALTTAREISASVKDAAEFQGRCVDAILALGNQLLVEYVEPLYVPETKRFKVTYDVKRSGTGELVVEAKDEAEAKAKAESLLRNDPLVHETLDDLPTDFVAADIVEAKEYRDGQA